MEPSDIKQELINPGFSRSEKISDLLRKAVRNFESNGEPQPAQ